MGNADVSGKTSLSRLLMRRIAMYSLGHLVEHIWFVCVIIWFNHRWIIHGGFKSLSFFFTLQLF